MQMSISNVQRLRQACGGLDKDGTIYGRLFSPIKSCELLISVEGFENSLQRSDASWIRLATTLLPIIDKSEKCRRIFMKLSRLILSNKSLDGRDKFLSSLWQYLERNISSNNLVLMELILSKDPVCFEMEIIGLFMQLLENINAKDLKTIIKEHPITHWCSKSKIVFSTATSITNEILLRSIENPSFSEKIASLIYLFKCCVTEMSDTVNLYPLKYQGLVSMLACMEGKFDEDGKVKVENETADERVDGLKKRVVVLVDSKLKNDPLAALAVLTHHPPWISFLHCEYNP